MNGNSPLRKLEDDFGSKWQSNKLVEQITGPKSTGLKAGWSLRKPIYNWIIYRVEDCEMKEELTIQEVEDIFECHCSKRNGVPNLLQILKVLRLCCILMMQH
jgi:hypothetical protein